MYPILEQELQILASGYSSAHLALFGIAVGGFTSSLITYVTVELPEPIKRRFFDAMLVSAICVLYFGIMAIRDWRRTSGLAKQLRKETVEVIVTKEQTI